MLKIAITPPDILDDEPRRIAMILDHGWDFVHLRHPSHTTSEVKSIIEALHPHLHKRLKLHGHFELLHEFNLGGIHLNSRCPETPARYNGAVSRTCHSINEVRVWADRVEYVTLSPIFDSISKIGYQSRLHREELKTLPEGKVVALGGITPERLGDIAGLPFVGFAMLGHLFDGNDLETLSAKLDDIDRLQY